MSHLSREDEILLREYQEAGEACRGHDTLVRTGLTIFGAAQAAIIGYIVTRGPIVTLELVLLEILGLWQVLSCSLRLKGCMSGMPTTWSVRVVLNEDSECTYINTATNTLGPNGFRQNVRGIKSFGQAFRL